MRAETILSELRTSGVEIVADGGHLRFRPVARVSEDLRQQLIENKPELLRLLTAASAFLAETLGGVTESEPTLGGADLCAMPLKQFAEARRVVRVRSEALGEVVVFASDNATVDPHESCVVYRAQELAELLRLGDRSLREVHRTKQTFRGTVQAS